MAMNERRRRAAQEAAERWVQLQSQELSRKGRAELVDWLGESPLHVEEMLRVARVHRTLEQFKGWDRIATEEPGSTAIGSEPADNVERLPAPGRPLPPPFPREDAPLRHRGWPGIALATAAAATLAMWLLTLLPAGYTVETAQGERRAITLTDGSVVNVDPQTQLRIRFDSRVRQIDLWQGRARFRVARNVTRPFLVDADDTVVRAVGTEFGVEHRGTGIIVTVAEGRVGVLPRDSASSHTDPAWGGRPEGSTSITAPRVGASTPPAGTPVLVSTGQQATVTGSGRVETVREVDAARELSWADGRLSFENERIASVVATFNRYNSLQMRVADRTLAQRRMSGVFDASDPESFIAVLQSVTSAHITRDGGEITIGPGP